MIRPVSFRSALAIIWMATLWAGHGEDLGGKKIQPVVVTETTPHDTDDPAIWINAADPLQSLILGTDKDSDGGLYAFDLAGRIVRKVTGLKRPNNVDVLRGFALGGKAVDIAVLTEREKQRLRVFRLPDLEPLERVDLIVFDGDTTRAPMGIALYQRPRDQAAFAIVSGKSGPAEGYLWQYRLEDDGQGFVKMALVRKFGAFSGKKEIEAVAVDAAAGSVYYSDEHFGIREYAADPDAPGAGEPRSVFGTDGFTKDREGIAIYPVDGKAGYLLVSDQQANTFRIFNREAPHELVKVASLSTVESDGSDLTPVPLGPKFPGGLFVAMSSDRTFHFYSWADIAGGELKSAALPVK
ncbi:MAG: phy [Akkermansiaceae bacterium]|nr:phy [Akkermansiaceae bacterium]